MKTSIRTSAIITLALLGFGPSPKTQAVIPPPDGGYPGFNTAEGQNALSGLTTGIGNTAVGWFSLFSDTDGSFNTAVGAGTLLFNIGNQTSGEGTQNTAVGTAALLSNTIGSFNTANGVLALFSNVSGNINTAVGNSALFGNTEGGANTAIGQDALSRNTTGGFNTAIGVTALFSNTTPTGNTAVGSSALQSNTTGGTFGGSGVDEKGPNTAVGANALFSNTTGSSNTAVGFGALQSGDVNDFSTAVGFKALANATGIGSNDAFGYKALTATTTGTHNTAIGDLTLFHNTTGANNVAVGTFAGQNQTTGNDNVYIGHGVPGVAGESGACYIKSIFGATSASGLPVLVNSSNKLGTTTSSRRFKQSIKPMDRDSESLFALNPVTFRYNDEIDPEGRSQFGLVAEDVENVSPDLIVRDKEKKPYSVRYDQVNAMLLNEFLKEHKRVEDLSSRLTEQETVILRQRQEFQTTVARQDREIRALIATVKEQAAQIQKVSAQVEVSKMPLQLIVAEIP